MDSCLLSVLLCFSVFKVSVKYRPVIEEEAKKKRLTHLTFPEHLKSARTTVPCWTGVPSVDIIPKIHFDLAN